MGVSRAGRPVRAEGLIMAHTGCKAAAFVSRLSPERIELD